MSSKRSVIDLDPVHLFFPEKPSYEAKQILKLSPTQPMDAKDPTESMLMKDPTDANESIDPTETPAKIHPMHARHAIEFALNTEMMAKIDR